MTDVPFHILLAVVIGAVVFQLVKMLGDAVKSRELDRQRREWDGLKQQGKWHSR